MAKKGEAELGLPEHDRCVSAGSRGLSGQRGREWVIAGVPFMDRAGAWPQLRAVAVQAFLWPRCLGSAMAAGRLATVFAGLVAAGPWLS